ncbi:hypothetical protein [Streptococcus cuniculi]|uniref:Uncharacterized protein n=1 Tax=Streptococcus cuniculi TaxID=1432788 RepID=A0A4Y9JC25_9STRE|nr:hypothetical protein [Streptococcus cuniculi]MBF0777444.1 hypothetical protein [Streptococcus cuniculi]TFU98502.1 hypothetical protein E4T82_01660 [Streptococcus cuniculi]
MSITDSSYNQIAKQVYNIEPSKAKSNGENPVLVDDTITDPNTKQKYQVLTVQDNNNDKDATNNNGMQAMAVAPVVNGKVDTSQVVIAYAGTNSSDEHDRDTDIQMIGLGDTASLRTDTKTVQIPQTIVRMTIDTTYTESQLKSAQRFYEQVQKEYPHAALTTTGHSLGAYLALIIAAENQVPATTFNGPDPMRGMSERAIAWVKANNAMYNNYRINFDIVGNFGAYFNDLLKSDKLGISRNVDAKKFYLNPIGYHDLAAFPVNKDGQIIDKDGNVVGSQYLSSKSYLSVLATSVRMASFDTLKSKWQKTGGGLSTSETIFLDAGQGAILGSSMAEAAKLGLDEMTSLKKQADSEAGALWSKVDFSIYSHLSYGEVQEIFASHGVTYEHIVSNFHEYTQTKVEAMQNLSTTFDTLKTKLDSAIEEKLALDNQLAGEFKTWYTGL